MLHRVVWDQYREGRDGIHLRSANLDGSNLRSIYDLPHGFTTELTMDRAGRRVAFAPCCRAKYPALVVVPVLGGKALKPLARHRQIDFVGGIGWSPSGSRLAFEGKHVTGPRGGPMSLWTIRPDGTGLKHVLTIHGGRPGSINDALAWTRDGILYSDGKNLRSASAGRSHLVLRHVASVRISGNGQHLVTERDLGQGQSVWIGNADGTGQRRVLSQGVGGQSPTYFDVVPSYDGSRLLADRMLPGSGQSIDDVVTWATEAGPQSATVVGFADPDTSVTWN
ncbi:MAG: WD40-like Beta Propeller Repeat [Marmoricola sp.]|nr:WD40-like Beta Propeller Repeat [Marmoricola sp.]